MYLVKWCRLFRDEESSLNVWSSIGCRRWEKVFMVMVLDLVLLCELGFYNVNYVLSGKSVFSGI